MVNLYVDNDSLANFRAQTLMSQAQGDYESNLSTLNAGYTAVQQAHASYYSRLADLNQQFYPSPQPAPDAASQQSSPSSAASAPGAGYSPYDDVFRKHAGDLANDPEFIKIVAAGTKAESGWNTNSTTGDGGHSWGLFQMHDAGAGAGMGASRLDPDAASAVMVPKYAAAYQQARAQGLTGAALAAATAQGAERSADPTGAAYARAYNEITGGQAGMSGAADVVARQPSVILTGGGAPVEASSLQTPKTVEPTPQTAEQLVQAANDSYQQQLQIMGVPNIMNPPRNAQEALQTAQDLFQNTPKPLIGPTGLGMGDPRIGPPGEEAEGKAAGPAGEIVASAEGEGQNITRGIRGGKFDAETGKRIRPPTAPTPEPSNPDEMDKLLEDMFRKAGATDADIAKLKAGEKVEPELKSTTEEQYGNGNGPAPQGPVQPPDSNVPGQPPVPTGAPPPEEAGQSKLPPNEWLPSGPQQGQLSFESPVPMGRPSNELPPNEQLPQGPQQGQLSFDSPIPMGGQRSGLPPNEQLPQGPQPGQLTLGLGHEDAPFAGQAPWQGKVWEPPKVDAEMNPVWATLLEGKKTLFSEVPFHHLVIGWNTLFGPAGPDGLMKYVGAMMNPDYFRGQMADLGEWVARTEKWGLGTAGVNPEAGAISPGVLGTKIGQTLVPAAGGFGVGYESTKAMGGSDEDAFRHGLLGAGLAAALGPTYAQTLHNMLWERGVPLAKVLTFKTMVENGAPEAQAARATRNLMGGGNLEAITSDQKIQTALRLGVVAPDWTIASFRLAKDAVMGTAKSVPGVESIPGLGPMTANQQVARDYWLKTIGTGMLLTEALQLGLTGHTTQQNQPGNFFKVEIPNDDKSFTTFTVLPSNVEQYLTLADNAISGGRHPGPDLANSALGAAGNYLSNRLGIIPRIGEGLLSNQRYPGGPAIVPQGTPASQAAMPEAAFAASQFGPIGLSETTQEYQKGAPLPAYLAALGGIKTGEQTKVLPQSAKMAQMGAPPPVNPLQYLWDVVSGQSTPGRAKMGKIGR